MQDEKKIVLSEAAGQNLVCGDKSVELLCPAGSPAAFDAALEAGADAIYIGGSAFNARINAKNFTYDDMKAAIRRAHLYGVKVYIAANTLIFDRECEEYMRAAREAYLAGADALIVADVGAASLIKKYIPDLELHASTQLSGHSVSAAERLHEAGFSRMVCAREMTAGDLREFTKHSPIEAEVFVHGALCVCHSGQCLFSSLVGGRSGNRGECAQPCRLPYKTPSGRGDYPLSLKDLCLAEHVTELIDMGVASFKIEGRMKSPEYVRDVARIWRRLIDERRNATRDEMAELARIFSRGGFTDAYYTESIGRSMMGVRSEGDKKESRELAAFKGIERKLPVSFDVKIKCGEPIALSVGDITVFGDTPEEALTAPIDEDTVSRCLGKLGGTPFEAKEIKIELDDGLMLPISKLNALRRAAVEKLLASNETERALPEIKPTAVNIPSSKTPMRTAVFYRPESLTKRAREFFDIIYLPLDVYDGSVEGVMLPAVIFDSERAELEGKLRKAVDMGVRHALVGNIGHIDLAREAGLKLHGDFRLNVTNRYSMEFYTSLGFEDIVLSPELTLPRLRDIGGESFAVVYGRAPLMVTEKCVGREISDCKTCREGKVVLKDRKNAEFPVLREFRHRSVIFNSVPTFMADKQGELDRAGLLRRHFIFTVEDADEVDKIISCYLSSRSFDKPFRRM